MRQVEADYAPVQGQNDKVDPEWVADKEEVRWDCRKGTLINAPSVAEKGYTLRRIQAELGASTAYGHSLGRTSEMAKKIINIRLEESVWKQTKKDAVNYEMTLQEWVTRALLKASPDLDAEQVLDKLKEARLL